MMTAKIVLEYLEDKKKANAIHRNNAVAAHGACSGLTAKQYKSVKTKVKGAGSKGRKHSHNKLWSYYNEPLQK